MKHSVSAVQLYACECLPIIEQSQLWIFLSVSANHDKIIVKSKFLLNKQKINKIFLKTPFIAANFCYSSQNIFG